MTSCLFPLFFLLSGFLKNFVGVWSVSDAELVSGTQQSESVTQARVAVLSQMPSPRRSLQRNEERSLRSRACISHLLYMQ